MKIPTPAEILAMQDISDQHIIESVQEKILTYVRQRTHQNKIVGTATGPLTVRIMDRVKYNFEQAGWKFEYKFCPDQRDGDYYEYTISHNLSM